MRKIEPSRASGESSYSVKLRSDITTPSFVPGSYDLMTPCKVAPQIRFNVVTITDYMQ